MMSYATTVFVFLFFCSCPSLAFLGLYRLEPRDEICYDTDTLRSFEYWIADSEPYCSSLLGISDVTTFVGSTISHTYVLRTPKSLSNIDESQNYHLHYYVN